MYITNINMDASEVISNMNSRWEEMLNNYYDHVSSTFLKHIAEEYDLDYDELQKKSEEVKEEIVKFVTNSSNTQSNIMKKKPSMSAVKNARKLQLESQKERNTYTDYTRSQLIEKCKMYKLPIKRKNQDMIDNLLEYDTKEAEKRESDTD